MTGPLLTDAFAAHAAASYAMAERRVWIMWDGGECPVPATTRVDVCRRGGEIMHNREASYWPWEHTPHQHYADIIAYRILD